MKHAPADFAGHATAPGDTPPVGAAPPPSTVEPSPARPPRRRRWSRVASVAWRHPMAASVVVLAAVALAVRLGVGWRLNRQWSDAQAAVAARGGTVDPADVLPADRLADDENAWTLQARAAATVQSLSPASGNVPYPDYPPFGPGWDQAAAASEAANASAFALAREARRLPRAQIPMAGGVPLVAVSLPHLSQSRELANALSDAALYKHLTGDEAEALGRVRDLLHVGRSLRQEPFLVTQLVAGGNDSMAMHAAQVIAAGLRLDGPGGPAAREQARGLIADLLDDADVLAGHRRSVGADWLVGAEMVRLQAQGTWAIAPLVDRLAARLAEAAAVDVEAAKADNAADALAVLARAGRPDRRPASNSSPFGSPPPAAIPRYSRWFGDDPPETGALYFRAFFGVLAQRRATAASLAAQLYRADHGGRWPDRLADLVPAYLAAVPADPFHADRRPIGYVVHQAALPGGRDRPLVYYDAGPADGVELDAEPMFGERSEIRPGQRTRDPFRQYVDLALWTPAARRFDVWQAEEAAREAEARRQEAAEAARRAEERRKALAENGLAAADAPATRPATKPATNPATP